MLVHPLLRTRFHLPPPKRPFSPPVKHLCYTWKVTVCVAAICDQRRSLVLATDQMIDFGSQFSGDGIVLKLSGIHSHWVAMFAGFDPTQAQPVLRGAWDRLDGVERHSLDAVERVVVEAYRNRLRRQQIDSVISQYGFDDFESFKKEGREMLGRYFSTVQKRIESVSLNCDLLIGGFDDHGTPHLLKVEHPGVSGHYDMLGFAAIGSGADATNNSLAFHSFNNRISLGLAIYYICAAKFMSEGTHGVGKNTSVVVGRIVDNNKVRWVEMSDLKLKSSGCSASSASIC